jgi:hypothetical protein
MKGKNHFEDLIIKKGNVKMYLKEIVYEGLD